MLPVLIKIGSVFGRPDFNEEVLEYWSLLSKGYFAGATKLTGVARNRMDSSAVVVTKPCCVHGGADDCTAETVFRRADGL
jgi:hypothetical protein